MGSRRDPGNARQRTGRPRKISNEQAEELVRLVWENPLLSLDDAVSVFRRQTGITLSTATVRKYLREAAFQRSQPSPAASAAAAEANGTGSVAAVPAEYGYRFAGRDPGDQVRYPCGLTDSEWSQVEHLFDPPTQLGRPEKYPRRQVLDACIHVLRSRCSWRKLPKDFPPWTSVYQTFRRWQAQGRFEAMYDELQALWRRRQHRAQDPTAAILDAPSVKTSAEGGPKGYEAGKKVKGRKRHRLPRQPEEPMFHHPPHARSEG